jgi:hypothetical protein
MIFLSNRNYLPRWRRYVSTHDSADLQSVPTRQINNLKQIQDYNIQMSRPENFYISERSGLKLWRKPETKYAKVHSFYYF